MIRYSENITISNNCFDEKLYESLLIHGCKNIEVSNNEVRESIYMITCTLLLFQNNKIQGDIYFESGFNISFHFNVFFIAFAGHAMTQT
jgi:parallel beta-helix repeat protein